MVRSVTLRGRGLRLKPFLFKMSFLTPFTENMGAELSNTVKIQPPAPRMPPKAAFGPSHERWEEMRRVQVILPASHAKADVQRYPPTPQCKSRSPGADPLPYSPAATHMALGLSSASAASSHTLQVGQSPKNTGEGTSPLSFPTPGNHGLPKANKEPY